MNLGEIYWAELPDRGGHEQRGRRPAIVWQDTQAFPQLPTILIIPLTAQLDTLRFGATLLIQPSKLNQLAAPSVALVFQLGACDVRRFGRQVGRLDDIDLQRVSEVVKKLQRFG